MSNNLMCYLGWVKVKRGSINNEMLNGAIAENKNFLLSRDQYIFLFK